VEVEDASKITTKFPYASLVVPHPPAFENLMSADEDEDEYQEEDENEQEDELMKTSRNPSWILGSTRKVLPGGMFQNYSGGM